MVDDRMPYNYNVFVDLLVTGSSKVNGDEGSEATDA